MVTVLSTLAPHLQKQVIEKVHVQDFLKLQRSSRYAHFISHQVKRRICFGRNEILITAINGNVGVRVLGQTYCTWVEKTPLRFLAQRVLIEDEMSEEFCRKLIDYFNQTKSLTETICFFNQENCDDPGRSGWLQSGFSLSMLTQLLKAAQATGFEHEYPLPLKYYQTPDIRALSSLAGDAPIDDCNLLQLQAKNMRFENTEVTSQGINMLLKEWHTGARDIDYIELRNSHLFDNANNWFNKDIILADIPYTDISIRSDFRIFEITRGDQKLEVQLDHTILLIEDHTVKDKRKVEENLQLCSGDDEEDDF